MTDEQPIEPEQSGAESLESLAAAGAAGASPEALPSKLTVVGIGASAGGLEALVELVRNVPLDSMAFVIVQHLAPHHDSMLAQLLARVSKIDVVTAADGMQVEANRVYVIPPNADLALMHGVLHLLEPGTARGPRLPVDFFLRSLADDQGASAIGIVLSGSGTDGTFGLEAIKAAGGVTFVQDPASAKFDGMPRSALAGGHADFCLAPKQIAEELGRIAAGIHAPAHLRPAAMIPKEQLSKLLLLIRSKFGNDFMLYKPASVERRIERRMMLHRIGNLTDYVRYVQSDAQELDALHDDLLITVTSFFRDPAAFEKLSAEILPRLLASRDPGRPIRVWVPACATGQEAYSIAICLLELLDEQTSEQPQVQIFGTDVDGVAIRRARNAVYPPNIVADVAPERLARFFVKSDGAYQVSRRVRDSVVFSTQNVLKDAPFSRMDLVSCRNLFIYLQPAVQVGLLRTLHYALNPVGFLLLGSSETVGDAADLFSLVDRKHKIYAKKHLGSVSGPRLGLAAAAAPLAIQPSSPLRPLVNLQALADKKALELYGPAGVVINDQLEVLNFRGQTGRYLDPAPGAASLNVLRLARSDLYVDLRRSIEQALSGAQRVTTDVRLERDGARTDLRLDVVPILEPETGSRCLLVLFHELPAPREVPVEPRATGDSPSEPVARRLEELERELAVTRDYLQATIEDREAANEDLRSANEELQSANEELQSTNEELETSREEEQATNEELTTLNEELQNRMVELSVTNDDLSNVLTGVDNAVLIVGLDLRIRRYTAPAEKLFNLMPADRGRSIALINPFVGNVSIEDTVRGVINSLSPFEEEILCSNQRWYLLRVTPYKTLDHAIRGAVITLSDIDVRKRAADVTRDVGQYAEKFLAAIQNPLVIVDAKQRIVWSNEAFREAFQLSTEETLGATLTSLGGVPHGPELRRLIDNAVNAAEAFRAQRVPVRGDERGTLVVSGNRLPLASEGPLVLLSIERE
jgi:two-component system, chemotaxis family, CheB/CheR fusion protein